MRFIFSYKKYEYSPKATFYSIIVGVITSIIIFLTFWSTIIVLSGLYNGIVEGDWDFTMLYLSAAVLVGIGYFVLLYKLVNPAIEKVALKDTTAVQRSLERPTKF